MSVDGAAITDDGPSWQSTMVDVSGMSLAEIEALAGDGESALAASLRRVADSLARPGEPIAGFNSAL